MFPISPFPKQILQFSPAKISDDLFCHRLQILNSSPIFAVLVRSPLFRKKYYFPYFCKFPSDFVKCRCFLHTLCVFRFPSTLTMMHLCITQCTYWTPLLTIVVLFCLSYRQSMSFCKLSQCSKCAHKLYHNILDATLYSPLQLTYYPRI